jgi:hypothetical protein
MVILLLAGIVFFLLVEIILITLPFADIKLGIITIPINLIMILIIGLSGLLGWYYVTIKYFWYQINIIKKQEIKN